MTNPKVTQKGRPALSAPIRVTDAAARRLDALADRLALRKVDLTRVLLAIGLDALEQALAGPDAGRVIAAIRGDGSSE